MSKTAIPDVDDETRRRKLREMALDDDLEAQALYRAYYKRLYGEEP